MPQNYQPNWQWGPPAERGPSLGTIETLAGKVADGQSIAVTECFQIYDGPYLDFHKQDKIIFDLGKTIHDLHFYLDYHPQNAALGSIWWRDLNNPGPSGRGGQCGNNKPKHKLGGENHQQYITFMRHLRKILDNELQRQSFIRLDPSQLNANPAVYQVWLNGNWQTLADSGIP